MLTLKASLLGQECLKIVREVVSKTRVLDTEGVVSVINFITEKQDTAWDLALRLMLVGTMITAIDGKTPTQYPTVSGEY